MTKVELVSKTQGVGIYDSLSQGEMVEAVARHGEKKDYGKLIKYLMKHKHWSPLEHVHFTFRIETARDISAQMMRHRSFHWQEQSQRYDVINDFMPIELRRQSKNNRQSSLKVFNPVVFQSDTRRQWASDTVDHALRTCKLAYDTLIEAGVARECARRILPMCAKTVVHMTGNLRDFLGYLNVRCEAGTQKEHRDVAMGIGEALEKEFPELAQIDWKQGGFL
jgi:thymidylate synthase (FAD)